MSNWQISTLGKVADFVLGKMLDQVKNKGELRPYLANINVRWGEFDLDNLREMRFEQREVDRYSLRYGDIVMCEGGEPGRCAIWRCREASLMIQKALHRIRPHDYLDSSFLYYAFLNLRRSDGFAGYFTGSTIKHLPREQLAKIEVRFPEISTQRAIAAILSAYDDLIANNQRRIALLERMAEDIYREWFVRLRFPGHEQVKIEKGVPQGWHFADLSEMAGINTSSIRKGTQSERIFYIDISAVSTNHIDDLTDMALADAPGRARRLVKHGDVVWSSVRPANRAYCLIYEPLENLVASTGFAVISPKRGFPFTFINFAVTSDSFVEQMAMVAKGSAYPATSFDDFGKAKIICPSPALLARFHEICEPMFKRRHQLRLANAALAKQRDALLPRLISGKLAVDSLDIRFPPGMEVLD